MQLLLTQQILKRLQRELRRAGSREIGGLLMGEHVSDELFRIVDISVQRTGGSHSCFIRNPSDHTIHLEKFFAQTGNDYTRFNYLGEWHSHPSFDPLPSATDVQAMQSIVNDPSVGAHFLVLLIPKIARDKQIEATAMAFRARTPPLPVLLLVESDHNIHPQTRISRWLRRVFGASGR
jgi:integrative and conjugative element protein (TIGR02256 family)